MTNRILLHLSKLDDFAEWAATRGYVREATHPHAAYEVLRLRRGAQVLSFFTREGAKEHASAYGAGLALVHAWIRERKREAKTPAADANETGGA